MTFLNPIWLFALAAISIPVVIHLWNIKSGKTLKVGSISLFTESSIKSSRSFKLQDILLLLMRCLLLILFAVLLAVPLWQQHLKATNTKGWLLIPPDNFRETYQKFKPVVDSLTKQGYEFHNFSKGFAKGDLAELLKDTAQLDSTNKPSPYYWPLFRQLAGKVPPTIPIEIFTPNGINHFMGIKPETNLKINWHTYTPADSVNTWLAGAWLSNNGSIRIMQGTAKPSGISYQYTDVKNGGQASPAYNMEVENGAPVISIKNANYTKIKIDTAIQRIAIYMGNNNVDANYLQAALLAVNQVKGGKVIIKQYNQPKAIPGNQDWLFWLSDKPADAGIAQRTKHLFVYEGGKINEINSWISNGTASVSNIDLYKSIAPKTNANNIWTDGFDKSILTIDDDKTITYHFYSRLNPAWNDLVWSDEFPKWLLELTAQPSPPIGLHERRTISTMQLTPAYLDSTSNINNAITKSIDLTRYLWLVLALLFFAERWLATRNQTLTANG